MKSKYDTHMKETKVLVWSRGGKSNVLAFLVRNEVSWRVVSWGGGGDMHGLGITAQVQSTYADSWLLLCI